MNLEQRLHHAARDLREVPVAVPPLRRTGARPRVHASATPVLVPLLFIAGALFAIGSTRPGTHQPIHSDLPAADRTVTPADMPSVVEDESGTQIVGAPSALVELQMIADFVGSVRTAEPAVIPDSNPVSATEHTGRSVDRIGIIRPI